MRWVLGLCLATSCASPVAPSPLPPALETITPPAAISGVDYEVELTLTGQRFAPIGNVVRVTPRPYTIAPWITVSDLSSDGRTIAFLLPKCLPARDDGGGPCFVLGLGNYDVTVTTTAGESNVLPLTLCVPWITAARCLAWGASL